MNSNFPDTNAPSSPISMCQMRNGIQQKKHSEARNRRDNTRISAKPGNIRVPKKMQFPGISDMDIFPSNIQDNKGNTIKDAIRALIM